MGAQAMTFEETPVTPAKKSTVKRVNTKLTRNVVDSVGTPTLIWYIVVRHRVGLMINFIVLENGYLVARYIGLV